jgi:hypothetical protein
MYENAFAAERFTGDTATTNMYQLSARCIAAKRIRENEQICIAVASRLQAAVKKDSGGSPKLYRSPSGSAEIDRESLRVDGVSLNI